MDTIDNRAPRRRPGTRPAAAASAFTLIELLITVAVAALLTTLAVPSMHRLLLAHRMTAQINILVTDLSLARGEAVMSNRQVVVCKSAGGRRCEPRARWKQGWILFRDNDRDEQRGARETLLRRHGPLPAGMSLHYAGFPSDRYVTFEATGISNANGMFVFCDGRGAASAKAVIISRMGRARTATRRPGGGALRC